MTTTRYFICGKKKMNTLSSCLLMFALIFSINADFIRTPVDVFTPMGTNSTFTCEINDYPDELVWIISIPGDDNIVIEQYSSEVAFANLRDKKIYFNSSANEMEIILTVLATIENNGTKIICIERTIQISFFSQQATLTVTAPPLAPSLSSNILDDAIMLTWGKPFTWPGHDILIYVITERDTNGDRTLSQPVNSQNSTHTHVYIVSSEVRDSCETVLLEVVAISDLGWSQAAESRIYLPRFPGGIGNVSAVAISDGSSSQLSISVQPPELCEFQSGNITVTVSRESNNETLVTKSLPYSGQPVELLFLVDVLDLSIMDNNVNYVMEVLAETMGMATTKTSLISGVLLDSLGTTMAAASSAQPTPNGCTTSAQCTLNDVVLIAVLATVAGVLLLTLFLVLVILAIVYLTRSSKGAAHMPVAGMELDAKENISCNM